MPTLFPTLSYDMHGTMSALSKRPYIKRRQLSILMIAHSINPKNTHELPRFANPTDITPLVTLPREWRMANGRRKPVGPCKGQLLYATTDMPPPDCGHVPPGIWLRSRSDAFASGRWDAAYIMDGTRTVGNGETKCSTAGLDVPFYRCFISLVRCLAGGSASGSAIGGSSGTKHVIQHRDSPVTSNLQTGADGVAGAGSTSRPWVAIRIGHIDALNRWDDTVRVATALHLLQRIY
ncbi:uncharacterized protein B0T15DRAFT_131723 [Chaetomium strumarium]|uniref:Uncharacterized protein n=1 Tax=Chaetomium strumarium TaxID=1170767 RepID=A0AAJ0M530_9PEZI|nr:hypothetical protein B0T15DRAFT_131723 [Chaetomium strumarium]